ncbi:uncharacterized protein MYCFIDRAFT_205283 [Pseudocercospora fijiensis CIRAD86]|uniref:Uncharacterized protein n=1 Tax=Pseudocercospora fijiensis (strain CIRAD86) TaxID=383855 RepID=M2YJ68_PSEFD|nr:uncharacterized protein MYCFIDRAFT_205283 [Pseudocercospora fijiensis CIRAD86]EME77760.1 hypothetical protein MYCFIDRAFT_205283 [Pseudocercospora fijiensis CIRAD86]
MLMTRRYASHMRATEENCSASRKEWLQMVHATAQHSTAAIRSAINALASSEPTHRARLRYAG